MASILFRTWFSVATPRMATSSRTLYTVSPPLVQFITSMERRGNMRGYIPLSLGSPDSKVADLGPARS